MIDSATVFLNRNPLLLWGVSFILGVISSFYFNVLGQVSLLVIVLLSILIAILKRYHTRFILLIGLFISLGSVLTFIKTEVNDLPTSDDVHIVKVSEFKRGRGVWDQVIAEDLKSNWFNVKKHLLIIEQGDSELKQGDILAVKSEFSFISNKNNPGEFDAETYWNSKGIQSMGFVKARGYLLLDTDNESVLTRFLNRIHEYSNEVLEFSLPESSKGLIKAMILGDKTDLDPDIKESFANAGAMHVLAVSGLHVGLIAYFLSFLLKRFLFRNKINLAVLVTILLLWIYAAITGFSPSVLRSVIMFSLLIGGQLYGRNTSSLNVLMFAAIIILAYNPFLLADLGFQLSFLAMTGIFTIYPLLVGIIRTDYKILNWLWQGSIVGVAAQVMTFPIALYNFHSFPNYFILSNIFVMVFATLLLGLGILLLLFGKLSFIAKPIGLVLGWSVFLFVESISLVDFMPAAVAYGFDPPTLWVILVYLMLLILTVKIYLNKRLSLELILFSVLMIFLQFDRYRNLSSSELVVFNFTDPVILLNHEGQQVCLYKASEVQYNKIERLVNDYQKIHPGEAKMIDIRNSNQQIKSKDYEIGVADKEGVIELSINGEHYVIIGNLKSYIPNNEINFIALPRLEKSKAWHHFLGDEAFRIPL